MDLYQLVDQSDSNNDNNLFWYKLCNCCPYGYHIDLDFVQYCNTIQHVDHTASMKRRKDRRRQRRSMVVLLGLETLSASEPSLKDKSIQQSLDVLSVQHFSQEKLYTEKDDLGDAVLDFEQTLKKSEVTNSLPKYFDIQNVHQTFAAKPYLNMTSNSASITDASINRHLNLQVYGLLPADLQNIREQMALSLERTKMVEELVKHIPLLQAQLAELKEEKRQLLLQIKMNKEAHGLINGQLHSFSSTSVRPHTKDFSANCSLLTLDTLNPHQKPVSQNVDRDSDKWFTSKSNFLNGDGNIYNNSMNLNQRTVTVAKETQTTLPREKKNLSIQTMDTYEVQHSNSILNYTKLFRSVGVSACVQTSDAITTPILSVTTVGVSDDTIEAELCLKCKYYTVTSTLLDQINPQFENCSVGCQYDLILKDIGVQYESHGLKDKCKGFPETINVDVGTNTVLEMFHKKKMHSVSSQHECLSFHKLCQVELKVKDRAVQHDIPIDVIAAKCCTKCNNHNHKLDTNVNTSPSVISLSSLSVPRSNSFSVLDRPSSQTVGCQYVPIMNYHKAVQIKPDVKHEASQCEDVPYFTKFTTRLGPKEVLYDELSSDNTIETMRKDKADSLIVPSKIPKLQSTPENKKLRRQDTYSVDLSQNIAMLINDNNEHESKPLNSNNNDDNGMDTSKLFTNLSSFPESKLHSDTERKKVIPSKSMRAALKVLSDCLKKRQTENLEDQLKNSINIVQLEWFKISSLIGADPLDVEDYLDFFEDISFDLLQYIVNMVDANGNTAMHYAISHGNFDVVSILLDSKVCDVNQTNKVGYTSVMLVSLVEITTQEHANVVRRLFKLADVNVRAKQNGQTALMLAVSHGQLELVQMLLEAGADINIQDEDGSTALMCAAEHGHLNIVKLFLNQPECDSTISDADGSTALTIAMEAGHRPIGVLLYTHQRIRKSSIQHSRSS